MADQATHDLRQTPLHGLHVSLGARMVPFAGYDMPVQFEGVKPEHLWTREHAGLFDVSHMGPCFLTLKDGPSGSEDAHKAIAALIEEVVPSNIAGLKPGQARLTTLLNDDGGILDDLIITRLPDEKQNGRLYIVVNGAVKAQDWALFEKQFKGRAVLQPADHRVLMALQGPEAVEVLKDEFPGCEDLGFMKAMLAAWEGAECMVSRCGYTGEDGFEILIPADAGQTLAAKLLKDDRVKPIGLGARDSLRLEAGLCLYGHDMDATRTPVEADLQWVIQKSRRERADFPGAAKILDQLANGPAEKRVGIRPLERAPAREGTEIQVNGETVGIVTSGGFGPTVDAPVAMGYIRADLAEPGTQIELMVRGKARMAEVAALPFVEHNYKR
ncbi:glycine cleavage system aminomethyltransferase GcvT [Henriciella mobilis]|uniref:aminomethyltransferase n=1 Tax=Henriciella mobilis TaxID=2305467 RepID=A0A399RSQ4_9PROT|nr:glycine cleavage system aminomethyltransferase GcvT [Henriciella mobilis]RIJ32917.1 glycine cleavage system aminomethyltransferase GcvT [Henriciella mobilis]